MMNLFHLIKHNLFEMLCKVTWLYDFTKCQLWLTVEKKRLLLGKNLVMFDLLTLKMNFTSFASLQ